MNSILLVEDDQSLGYILKEYLEINDFQVVWCKDGEEGLAAFGSVQFDICILDIMMPKKDGLSLAVEIKNIDSHIPIIFLTAKSLKVDKLKGFKVGGDDYIVKPVDEEELIARINAVLRRSQQTMVVSEPEYTFGIFHFNTMNRQLTVEDTVHQLSEKESAVLSMLCAERGMVVTRDRILAEAWGENNYFNRRSMDVFISKLRKHLREDPTLKIKNVHGKGFVLEET